MKLNAMLRAGSRFQRIAAVVVVTAITLALAGAVVLSTTSLGCGPANAMRVKFQSARCETVALLQSPSASFPAQTPGPGPDRPSSSSPFPEPASSNPISSPFPEPASSNPNSQPPSDPYIHTGGGVEGGITSFMPASGSAPRSSAMNCRLPVYAGSSGSGGFIVFPSGDFQPDPRSAVTAPSPSTGTSQGFWGLTYDRAFSRWLPVPRRWVSPDGVRYAFPGYPDGIFVQNLASGTQVKLGEGAEWTVLDVEADGVYAVKGSLGGLWLLPFTGGVTTITTSGYWQAVGGGAAYGTITSSVPSAEGNTIIRLDLNSKSITDYFKMRASLSVVAGVGVGDKPVIYTRGWGLEIWTDTGAGVTGIAWILGAYFYPNGPPSGDSLGLWLASNDGIALYVNGHGWELMSKVGGQLAGGCI